MHTVFLGYSQHIETDGCSQPAALAELDSKRHKGHVMFELSATEKCIKADL